MSFLPASLGATGRQAGYNLTNDPKLLGAAMGAGRLPVAKAVRTVRLPLTQEVADAVNAKSGNGVFLDGSMADFVGIYSQPEAVPLKPGSTEQRRAASSSGNKSGQLFFRTSPSNGVKSAGGAIALGGPKARAEIYHYATKNKAMDSSRINHKKLIEAHLKYGFAAPLAELGYTLKADGSVDETGANALFTPKGKGITRTVYRVRLAEANPAFKKRFKGLKTKGYQQFASEDKAYEFMARHAESATFTVEEAKANVKPSKKKGRQYSRNVFSDAKRTAKGVEGKEAVGSFRSQMTDVYNTLSPNTRAKQLGYRAYAARVAADPMAFGKADAEGILKDYENAVRNNNLSSLKGKYSRAKGKKGQAFRQNLSPYAPRTLKARKGHVRTSSKGKRYTAGAVEAGSRFATQGRKVQKTGAIKSPKLRATISRTGCNPYQVGLVGGDETHAGRLNLRRYKATGKKAKLAWGQRGGKGSGYVPYVAQQCTPSSLERYSDNSDRNYNTSGLEIRKGPKAGEGVSPGKSNRWNSASKAQGSITYGLDNYYGTTKADYNRMLDEQNENIDPNVEEDVKREIIINNTRAREQRGPVYNIPRNFSGSSADWKKVTRM